MGQGGQAGGQGEPIGLLTLYILLPSCRVGVILMVEGGKAFAHWKPSIQPHLHCYKTILRLFSMRATDRCGARGLITLVCTAL